jgi:hypothetical protein
MKNSILGILLLISFSLYAGSPISYAYHDEKSENDWNYTQKEDSVQRSIRLVLFGLLFADTINPQTQEKSSAERFLIKKGKVLTEGKQDIPHIQTADILVFVHDPTPSFAEKHSYIQTSLPKPYPDFLAFFTGLSPPQFNP